MTEQTEPVRPPPLSRRRLFARALGIAGLAALAPLAGTRRAQAAAPAAQLTEEELRHLRRVEEYLNGIKTMRARFQQFSPNSGLAFGTIYLSRPGRMRVEYDPPVPVLLVADGMAVSYYDRELDNLSQVPLSSTPAWFLLRNPIRLQEDLTVTRLDTRPGALRLSMYQTKEPEAGTVTLIFADDPLELKNWTIVDGAGNEVTIGLFDVSIGGEIENKLFATPQTRGRRSSGNR